MQVLAGSRHGGQQLCHLCAGSDGADIVNLEWVGVSLLPQPSLGLKIKQDVSLDAVNWDLVG